VEEIASTYEEPQEVVDYYYGNREQLAAVESRVLEDTVVEKLLEKAQITQKQCSYEEALARDNAAAGA